MLSKYAWVEPLKSKSATALVEALERLWTLLGTRQPQHVQTDSGGEFYYVKVQAFFKKHQVNHFSTHGNPYGSVVERWNRTLKAKMFRYFTANNTLKYIDVLPAHVKTYNHSFHSSIQEKPLNVTPENEHEIWYRLYGNKKGTPLKKPKRKVGDKVRLNKKFRPFKKGYLPGWTEEVFLVQQIYTTQPVVTYKLTERNCTLIKGTFQVFVSWKGWPKEYNSWVWKKDLQVL